MTRSLRTVLWRAASNDRTTSRKHLVLLIALISVSVVQPLFAHSSELVANLTNAGFGLAYLFVVYVVFAGRRLAYRLFLPVIASHFALYVVPDALRPLTNVVFHVSVVVFLGYAVVAILRDLFARTVISGDDVLGAVCGYVLGGLVWGHLYALTYMLRPDAFSVSPELTAQLADLRLRHVIFDYFSYTTLTSIGYGDITPIGSPVYTLVWLEVMFGQFYMAVVVAQLVGMKLAQAIDHRRPPTP